ncbi:MAG TPA: hypothetical protein VFK27_01870, partial [Bacillales bacterium]|nr:hypothetical protein [Bacillales bacterium]
MNRNKGIVFSALFLLIFGFFVSFSYPYAMAGENMSKDTDSIEQWKINDKLRTKVLEQQHLNHELWNDIRRKRDHVDAIESKFSSQKQRAAKLVENLRKYRKLLGKEEVEGP